MYVGYFIKETQKYKQPLGLSCVKVISVVTYLWCWYIPKTTIESGWCQHFFYYFLWVSRPCCCKKVVVCASQVNTPNICVTLATGSDLELVIYLDIIDNVGILTLLLMSLIPPSLLLGNMHKSHSQPLPQPEKEHVYQQTVTEPRQTRYIPSPTQQYMYMPPTQAQPPQPIMNKMYLLSECARVACLVCCSDWYAFLLSKKRMSSRERMHELEISSQSQQILQLRTEINNKDMEIVEFKTRLQEYRMKCEKLLKEKDKVIQERNIANNRYVTPQSYSSNSCTS